MKLNEIFDIKITDRKLSKDIDYDKLYDEQNKKLVDASLGGNFKGVGLFGYVKKGGDPFLINKKSHMFTNLENDGYFTYIKYIVDNKLSEKNPYFPRVYEIKTFTDNNQNKRYSIKLETLIDLNDLDEDELYNLINNLFKDADAHIAEMKSATNVKQQKTILFFVLEDLIKSSDLNLYSKDELLYDAIKIIRTIKASSGFEWDLHAGNMMARRGKTGLQLVITDPLS